MTIQEMQEKRRELGFSYEMLSKISGVPMGTVQKIFGGITTSPRYGTIQRLTAALSGHYPLTEEQRVCFSDDVDWEGGEDLLQESSAPYDSAQRAAALPPKKAEMAGPENWIDPARQGSYTIDDLEKFPEHFRVELDDGVIIVMESPSLLHQEMVMSLQMQFYSIIKKNKGPCRVISAPYNLHFSPEDKKNSRQPDILVVCDRSKLTRKCCVGGPDLAVEVLSSSTQSTDMNKKHLQYSEIGVREYWIVDPKKKKILVYPFEEGGIPEVYGFQDRVPIHIWPGEEVDFAEISEEIAYAFAMEEVITTEKE